MLGLRSKFPSQLLTDDQAAVTHWQAARAGLVHQHTCLEDFRTPRLATLPRRLLEMICSGCFYFAFVFVFFLKKRNPHQIQTLFSSKLPLRQGVFTFQKWPCKSRPHKQREHLIYSGSRACSFFFVPLPKQVINFKYLTPGALMWGSHSVEGASAGKWLSL